MDVTCKKCCYSEVMGKFTLCKKGKSYIIDFIKVY